MNLIIKKVKSIIKHSFLGRFLLFLRRLYYSPKLSLQNKIKLPVFYLRDSNNAVFFGYHDKTPFSGDNSKVLANSVKASDKSAKSEGALMKIGYFTLNSDLASEFIQVAETTTWCWQQGCMLQWNNKNPNKEIIFNKLIKGNYGSVILNINTKEIVKEFETPIYSISPCGNLAASVNFARLGRLRPGYGYTSIKDTAEDICAPKDDGLFIVNLNSGNKKLIISLYNLSQKSKQSELSRHHHYINHISFSPDGKNLVFFYISTDSLGKRTIRFLSYNFEKKNIKVIEDNRIVSHFCWNDNNTILATTKEKEDSTWEYLFYNIKGNATTHKAEILLSTDGHPMCSPFNNSVFVADSRLDKLRNDSIIIFSTKDKYVFNVADFLIPFGYEGQVRCDLHPRWDRKGRFICADVVYKNKRAMAIVKTSLLLKNHILNPL